MHAMSDRATGRSAFVVFVGFVALGLPIGTFGVAWPAMRDELGAPLAGLGVLLAALSFAEAASSAVVGVLITRLGAKPILLGSAIGASGSLALIGVAQSWEISVAGALLLGASMAFLDVGVNAYGALTQGIRYLGALHGSWAIGASLGPPAVGIAIIAGGSWRLGFLIVAAFFFAVAIALARTHLPAVRPAREQSVPPRRIPIVALGCVLFYVYVGIEVGAGSWAFVRLTDAGLADAAAGAAVTAYWAMLAATRFGLAFWGDRVSPETLLDVAFAGTLAAGIGMSIAPVAVVALAILPLLGAALGMIIPLLVFVTPGRVGRTSASVVIGFQFAGAMLGGAMLPAAIGYVMERSGTGSLGPAIAALCIVFAAAHVVMRSLAKMLPRTA
jgi:fucose permease